MSTDTRTLRSDVRHAVLAVVTDDCEWSCGNATSAGLCSLFGLSLLKYWFVNGVVDFSSALVLGSVASTLGLVLRLGAYVLVVPAFLGLRLAYYAAHPSYRRALVGGSCPSGGPLSLDWFTVGILATGLPVALQDLGPWVGMNAAFLLGLFVVPRFLSAPRLVDGAKLGSVALGGALFLYANYAGPVAAATPLPAPAAVLGPVATLRLSDATARFLYELVNSVLLGPPVVAAFALLMNRVLTHPAVASTPVVRHATPRRDPARRVLVSAALGTWFYLLVVAVGSGRLVVLP